MAVPPTDEVATLADEVKVSFDRPSGVIKIAEKIRFKSRTYGVDDPSADYEQPDALRELLSNIGDILAEYVVAVKVVCAKGLDRRRSQMSEASEPDAEFAQWQRTLQQARADLLLEALVERGMPRDRSQALVVDAASPEEEGVSVQFIGGSFRESAREELKALADGVVARGNLSFNADTLTAKLVRDVKYSPRKRKDPPTAEFAEAANMALVLDDVIELLQMLMVHVEVVRGFRTPDGQLADEQQAKWARALARNRIDLFVGSLEGLGLQPWQLSGRIEERSARIGDFDLRLSFGPAQAQGPCLCSGDFVVDVAAVGGAAPPQQRASGGQNLALRRVDLAPDRIRFFKSSSCVVDYEVLVSDLESFCAPESGTGVCLRMRDGRLLTLHGPECGSHKEWLEQLASLQREQLQGVAAPPATDQLEGGSAADVASSPSKPAQGSGGVVCQALLEVDKKGERTSRYFVLYREALRYYTSQEDFENGAAVRGELLLSEVFRVRATEEGTDIFWTSGAVGKKPLKIFYASGDQGKAWTSAWRSVLPEDVFVEDSQDFGRPEVGDGARATEQIRTIPMAKYTLGIPESELQSRAAVINKSRRVIFSVQKGVVSLVQELKFSPPSGVAGAPQLQNPGAARAVVQDLKKVMDLYTLRQEVCYRFSSAKVGQKEIAARRARHVAGALTKALSGAGLLRAQEGGVASRAEPGPDGQLALLLGLGSGAAAIEDLVKDKVSEITARGRIDVDLRRGVAVVASPLAFVAEGAELADPEAFRSVAEDLVDLCGVFTVRGCVTRMYATGAKQEDTDAREQRALAEAEVVASALRAAGVPECRLRAAAAKQDQQRGGLVLQLSCEHTLQALRPPPSSGGSAGAPEAPSRDARAAAGGSGDADRALADVAGEESAQRSSDHNGRPSLESSGDALGPGEFSTVPQVFAFVSFEPSDSQVGSPCPGSPRCAASGAAVCEGDFVATLSGAGDGSSAPSRAVLYEDRLEILPLAAPGAQPMGPRVVPRAATWGPATTYMIEDLRDVEVREAGFSVVTSDGQRLELDGVPDADAGQDGGVPALVERWTSALERVTSERQGGDDDEEDGELMDRFVSRMSMIVGKQMSEVWDGALANREPSGGSMIRFASFVEVGDSAGAAASERSASSTAKPLRERRQTGGSALRGGAQARQPSLRSAASSAGGPTPLRRSGTAPAARSAPSASPPRRATTGVALRRRDVVAEEAEEEPEWPEMQRAVVAPLNCEDWDDCPEPPLEPCPVAARGAGGDIAAAAASRASVASAASWRPSTGLDDWTVEKLREVFDLCPKNEQGRVNKVALMQTCRQSPLIADFLGLTSEAGGATLLTASPLEAISFSMQVSPDGALSWQDFVLSYVPYAEGLLVQGTVLLSTDGGDSPRPAFLRVFEDRIEYAFDLCRQVEPGRSFEHVLWSRVRALKTTSVGFDIRLPEQTLGIVILLDDSLLLWRRAFSAIATRIARRGSAPDRSAGSRSPSPPGSPRREDDRRGRQKGGQPGGRIVRRKTGDFDLKRREIPADFKAELQSQLFVQWLESQDASHCETPDIQGVLWMRDPSFCHVAPRYCVLSRSHFLGYDRPLDLPHGARPSWSISLSEVHDVDSLDSGVLFRCRGGRVAAARATSAKEAQKWADSITRARARRGDAIEEQANARERSAERSASPPGSPRGEAARQRLAPSAPSTPRGVAKMASQKSQPKRGLCHVDFDPTVGKAFLTTEITYKRRNTQVISKTGQVEAKLCPTDEFADPELAREVLTEIAMIYQYRRGALSIAGILPATPKSSLAKAMDLASRRCERIIEELVAIGLPADQLVFEVAASEQKAFSHTFQFASLPAADGRAGASPRCKRTKSGPTDAA